MSASEKSLSERETEVVAKATRRRFTLEYKRRIVRDADSCKTPGAVGALLRREGLYSSHLAVWRAARERGELAGVKKRGPAPRAVDPRDKTITAQAGEIMPWKHRAERAEALVELQKTWRRCWGRRSRTRSPDDEGNRAWLAPRHHAHLRGPQLAAGDVLPAPAAPECSGAAPTVGAGAQPGRTRDRSRAAA